MLLLKYKHILNWNFDELNELKERVIDRYIDYTSLSPDTIFDILLCGSRVHYLSGDISDNIYFNKNSDLDIDIIIDDEVFDKEFLDMDLLKGHDFSKVKKQWKLWPIMPSLIYESIVCSLFIHPKREKKIVNNVIVKNKYYNKWDLGYYSLCKHFYYFGNKYHKLDYVMNLKTRLEKFKFCVICYKHKDATALLNIKVIPEQARLEDDEYSRDWKFCICEECYNKLFSNGIEHFINHLREVKEKCI